MIKTLNYLSVSLDTFFFLIKNSDNHLNLLTSPFTWFEDILFCLNYSFHHTGILEHFCNLHLRRLVKKISGNFQLKKKKNPTTGLITALQEERNMKKNRRHSGCQPVKFSTISHNNMQACLFCRVQCNCRRSRSGIWSYPINDKMASG